MFRRRFSGSIGFGTFQRRGLLALALALGLSSAGLSTRVTADAKAAMPVGDPNSILTSAQCAECHPTEPGLSHPVMVTPALALPPDWPLDNGQLNCTTCHLDTIASHQQAAGALLRGSATGASFCARCHTATSNTRQRQHPLAISKAHLLTPGGVPSTTDTTAAGVTVCLACHDGAVAPDAYGGLGACIGVGTARNHPVGVNYPSATLHVGGAAFKAATLIDRRVRLTGGQVTCNACHSLYSPLPRLLVVPNDRSTLCLNCHAQ